MLKATGVVRKLDDLGRFCLPKEIRRNLSILEQDSLEVFVDQDKIILKKYQPSCIFCGNAADVKHFHDKLICKNCVDELS